MSENRNIFRYFDGKRELYADPVEIHRKLSALLGGDINRFLREMRSPEAAVSIAATDRMRYAVCQAFGLGTPFDPTTGHGVMEEAWMGSLTAFTDYCEAQKKSGDSTPT